MKILVRILRIIMPVLLAVTMLTGCKYKDIRVDSCKIEDVSPRGLKALNAKVAVNVHNPAKEILLTDIAGTVYYDGEVLGHFTSPDITVPGRQSTTVHAEIKASVPNPMNLMNLMGVAFSSKSDKLTLDLSLNVKVKGMAKKKIELKDLPLEEFFRKVSYESI